jgi:hypothetical protein
MSKKISRLWIIRQLCQKKFGAKRPTALEINDVISKYGLNRYTTDGKKRSREVMTEAVAKAYKVLH